MNQKSVAKCTVHTYMYPHPMCFSLHTGDLQYEGEVCVRFAYHMWGQNMGRLQVWTSAEGDPVWEKAADQRNTWHSAAVNARIERGEAVCYKLGLT